MINHFITHIVLNARIMDLLLIVLVDVQNYIVMLLHC